MIAVVTGASRGIGEAVGARLASSGYRVVGLSRTPSGFGAETCDVSDEAQVQRVFRRIAKVYGPPSVLVNCAGTVKPQPLCATSWDDWREQVDVNLGGAFLCAREFTRYCPIQGGVIVNVASTAGLRPSPGWAAYAASKAGLVNLSATLAEELKPRGVRVHCIAPGRTATALRAVLAPDEDPASIMQPAEVAEVVFGLVASPFGNVVDGQPVVVRR